MNAALAWLFATGHAADLVLAVFAIEAVWLVRSGRMHWQRAAAALLPGIAIVIALRAALVGAGWPVVAVLLAAALPLHLLDLAGRGVLRRRTRPR